jgi:flagellar basal body-associated protein FliL
MHNLRHKNENGAITGSLITIILLSILFAAAGSAAIWAFMNYTEQKTNVDGKIDVAVAEARKEQSDIESAKFA